MPGMGVLQVVHYAVQALHDPLQLTLLGAVSLQALGQDADHRPLRLNQPRQLPIRLL